MKIRSLFLILFFLMGLFSACQKDSEGAADPVDTFETGLVGTLNSQSLNVNSAGIETRFFQDAGETVGALEIGATLPNSERLTFFIQEAKAGSITLTQAFPAVMGINSEGLKTTASAEGKSENDRVQTLPPNFVKYLTSSQTYFATGGTLTVTVDKENLTVTWTINFKDINGNAFTSTGTVKIKNFTSNKRPKSEINSPTSNLAITSISPEYAKAGDEVVITGTGFSALKSENQVTLGTVAVTVNDAIATAIKVSVPTGAVNGKFKLAVLGSSVESKDFFFIPIISGLSKTAAKVGETVLIEGNHFDSDKTKLQVKLGDLVLPITASSYTSITVELPQTAKSGKITVARVGKDPVEGPELTIESSAPPLQGPPVNEIFEVVSGNLTFSEIFTNNTEYGAVLHFFIDQKNSFLYALTQRYLLQINLSNRNVKVIADPLSPIFKRDVPLPGPAYAPSAFFAAPDGMIYGYRSAFSAILSPSNVFKINPQTGAISDIGNIKIDAGASQASMFVDATGNLYFNEFANGYSVNSYNNALQNKKQLIGSITGELVSGFVPTGENSFRVTRGFLLAVNDEILFHDVTNNQAGSLTDWTSAVSGLRPTSGHTLPALIGFGHKGGDYHGFMGSLRQDDNRPFVEFPKLVYTIGVQSGGQGSFVKKGEFNIIQKFTFGSQPRYVRAYAQSYYRNVYGVDSEGNSYILIQTPLNPSTGAELAPGVGGIYKVSY
ncbi:MAG: IPT/TIG domain-containing protein [Algoriphagus aquaeductus]|uniref:IPT/TIG domain-containing protein n=1 Tax=Algoriphagus aquaeductus TaxID=475299 RepID=UPI003879C306